MPEKLQQAFIDNKEEGAVHKKVSEAENSIDKLNVCAPGMLACKEVLINIVLDLGAIDYASYTKRDTRLSLLLAVTV